MDLFGWYWRIRKGASVALRLPCFPQSNLRIMCEIEQSLIRGVKTPRIQYHKGKIERYELEIKRILRALDAQSSHLMKTSMWVDVPAA